jgi:succinate dehydrogenase / fumarate reductase iron-sulfur subunit
MVQQMDQEGFGNCSNHAECEAACPKAISIDQHRHMRRDYLTAARVYEERAEAGGAG